MQNFFDVLYIKESQKILHTMFPVTSLSETLLTGSFMAIHILR